MKVLVTGSNGFIAKNLIQFLSEKTEVEVLKVHRESSEQELKESILAADWIVHLAGINRPLNESEFIEGNVTLTEKIAQTLREGHKLTPVILSSSIQADRDNAYGKSKLGGEQALEKLHAEQGNPVYICRLANVFGKWSRPNYNSAVATFCHNVANDLPLQINDANAIIRLVYIDDVVDGEHITYAFNKPAEKKYFKKGKLYRFEKLDDSGNVNKSYTIKNETDSKLDCIVVENLSKGIFTQTYSFVKTVDFVVSPITFHLDFEGATESIKKRNGLFEHKSLDGKIISIGNYTSNVKTGTWENYYYDQNVRATFTYDGYGQITNEYYFDLKRNEPFSDEFIFKAEDGTYEERKIKNGVRNGTTRYKDANDKTLKKESYKDGILKE